MATALNEAAAPRLASAERDHRINHGADSRHRHAQVRSTWAVLALVVRFVGVDVLVLKRFVGVRVLVPLPQEPGNAKRHQAHRPKRRSAEPIVNKAITTLAVRGKTTADPI